jgi:acetyl-CoA carboxylase carboxyl transferase subunit beta
MSLEKLKNPGIKTPFGREEDKVFKAPEGFWIRCDQCGAIIQQAAVTENFSCCTECQHHYRLPARDRITLLTDADSFVEWDQDLKPRDFLEFFDSQSYCDRLTRSQKKTGVMDAFIAGEARIENRPVQFGCFEFAFMGGSMGTIVGEKIARLFERSLEKKQPAIVVQSSGGARMQEGLSSLMQMSKTLAVLSKLNEAGIPYISVLTDPTTGGVAASFAIMGDVNVAEPKALIGFAGPRVIQQTINERLPENFQRAEFLLDHGMIDAIVPRAELRSYIARVLRMLCR